MRLRDLYLGGIFEWLLTAAVVTSALNSQGEAESVSLPVWGLLAHSDTILGMGRLVCQWVAGSYPRAMHLACPLLPSLTAICGGATAETYKQLGWGFGAPRQRNSFPQMPSLLPTGSLRLVDGGKAPFPGPRILSKCLWVTAGESIRRPCIRCEQAISIWQASPAQN